MAYDVAIVLGSIALFFMFAFMYDRSENPFIKTTLLGWVLISPFFVLYWLSKLEEFNSIGNFYHYLLKGYGIYIFIVLIFQLYTYFFASGKQIYDRK